MANRDRLVREAFAQLTGDSQDPSADDYAKIDKAVDGKLAELSRRGVVTIPDVSNFDDALLEHLALSLASSFGLAKNFGTLPSADEIAFAEGRLRQIVAGSYIHNPARPSYF